jgi:hypothetical protein
MRTSYALIRSATRARNRLGSRAEDIEVCSVMFSPDTSHCHSSFYSPCGYRFAHCRFLRYFSLLCASLGLECADIPAIDSIYMAIPSSLSYLLDSSLPLLSPQSTDISLYVPRTEAPPPASMDTDSDDQEDSSVCLELSMTRDPWPLSPLCDVSSPRALALSPAGNSSVSVDWPPTGPALLPADDVSREGDEAGIQVSDVVDLICME